MYVLDQRAFDTFPHLLCDGYNKKKLIPCYLRLTFQQNLLPERTEPPIHMVRGGGAVPFIVGRTAAQGKSKELNTFTYWLFSTEAIDGYIIKINVWSNYRDYFFIIVLTNKCSAHTSCITGQWSNIAFWLSIVEMANGALALLSFLPSWEDEAMLSSWSDSTGRSHVVL